MTLITFSDGKVVMRDGKVGTEQECCCSGCCCIDQTAHPSGYTQQTCEECDVTYECQEYIDDNGNPCPEGWDSNGFGGCLRTTAVESCAQCEGECSTIKTGTCGKWLPQGCDPGPCDENYHLCDCQCLPNCVATPFAEGTQLWNGGFNLEYMGVTYPPGSTVPWSTANNDGVNDQWDSWAVSFDCSSLDGEPNAEPNREPPFDWTQFFLPCGGSIILQVTIPCDACGYAIASPSVNGFVLVNVPAGNDANVTNFSIALVCP